MKNSEYAGETTAPSTPGSFQLNEIIYLCTDCPSLIEIISIKGMVIILFIINIKFFN